MSTPPSIMQLRRIMSTLHKFERASRRAAPSYSQTVGLDIMGDVAARIDYGQVVITPFGDVDTVSDYCIMTVHFYNAPLSERERGEP